MLLVLEDVHWADRSSHDLLAFLARNLRDERLAIVATYRTDELAEQHAWRRLVHELVRRRNVLRVTLSPLTAAEVARQLEAIAGRPVAGSLAERLHARAGGNPFFVEELLAAGGGGSEPVPDTLAEAVLVRTGRLEPAAQEILGVVAAAGGRADHELLEAVAEHSDGLRAAIDANILVREPGDRGVAFRHGLLGEVVYGRLLPQERRRLHHAIATALAATPGASPAQLAYQWHRAGEPADALHASVAAGLEASGVYAFAEARAHLERALELWDAVQPAAGSLPLDRVELLARAAQAARFAGDPQRAIALCEEALDRLDAGAEPVRAALLYERLGEFHFWDDAAALGCYRQALSLLPEEAVQERARLRSAEAHALMGLRRWAEARACCEAALAHASELEAVAARTTLGLVLGFLGEPEAGEEQISRALESAESLGAGETRCAPTSCSASCGACAETTRGRSPSWSAARRPPRGWACAARSATSCMSTGPTICCDSVAGTIPARAWTRRGAWTWERRARCSSSRSPGICARCAGSPERPYRPGAGARAGRRGVAERVRHATAWRLGDALPRRGRARGGSAPRRAGAGRDRRRERSALHPGPVRTRRPRRGGPG